MRRLWWLLAATCCLVLAGCGKNIDEDTPSRGRSGGKADGLASQLGQLKSFNSPYVMVGQYLSCDEACVNQTAVNGDAIRGVSDGCCTPFTPSLLTSQTFGTGQACPQGLNPVMTQVDGKTVVACQVFGGGHQVYIPRECDPYAFDADDCPGGGTCSDSGYCEGGTGRELIDSANQARRLHPELVGEYLKFDSSLTSCGTAAAGQSCAAGVEDVFASQWWAMSKNGIAERWVPGAVQGYENYSDPKTLSPTEKYDLLFSKLSTSCADADKVTVNGRTFCPQKVKCGSNRCQDASGGDVSCNSADARYCVNYSWKETQDGCPNPSDTSVSCSPQKHPLVKVIGPATKWELENHGKYQRVHPDSWWGHCNGWASYATAEAVKFPEEDLCVKVGDQGKITRCTSNAAEVQQCGATEATQGCVLFRMGDMEALMTELYNSDAATFTGRRCNELPEDIEMDDYGRPKRVECRDINAGTFHIAVTGMLGKGVTPFSGGAKTKLPFIIDHNYDYQVWNFPLVRFEFVKVSQIAKDGSNCPVNMPTIEEVQGKLAAANLSDEERQSLQQLLQMLQSQPRDRVCAALLVAETSNGDYSKFNPHPSTRDFVTVTMNYWMVSDGVSAHAMMKRADLRGVAPHKSEMNYVLELSGDGEIKGGEWTKNPAFSWGEDNKTAHPDFLWAAIKPQANDDPTDMTDDDNPAVNYLIVKALLQCANDAATCSDGGGGGGNGQTEVIFEVSGESVAKNETRSYAVSLPQGATKIEVHLTPTAGDPDLTEPCNEWKSGLTPELCTVLDPTGDTLTVKVWGYSASKYGLKVLAFTGGGGEPPPPANICAGHCDGSVSVGSASCYCDAACSGYGDCCQDSNGAQGPDPSYVNEFCP